MLGELSFFRKGELLTREDDISRKMFILVEGKVRVFKTHKDKMVTLATLGRGEIFGEMSFFDGEPRSASVQALTNVQAKVIDGDEALSQVDDIPKWVFPVFKTITERLRVADQKIAVLKSSDELYNKNLNIQAISKMIYEEMLRFLKVITLVVEQGQKDSLPIERQGFLEELDLIIGRRFIGLKVFVRLLIQNECIDPKAYQKGEIVLNQEEMRQLRAYLVAEIEAETYTMISYASLNFLRKVILNSREKKAFNPVSEQDHLYTIGIEQIHKWGLENLDDALAELDDLRAINRRPNEIVFNLSDIYTLYFYQSILKNFDHTIMQVD